jgi:hypothetical protein
MDIVKTGGRRAELMVMSVDSQDSQNLPRSQTNAHVDHPDESVTKNPIQNEYTIDLLQGRISMNKVSSDSLIDIEFRLNWKSAEAAHTEVYYGQRISLWGIYFLRSYMNSFCLRMFQIAWNMIWSLMTVALDMIQRSFLLSDGASLTANSGPMPLLNLAMAGSTPKAC